MELKHHGILGMHWGERRYQNSDGSLTPEGKKRYKYNKTDAIYDRRVYGNRAQKRIQKRVEEKGNSKAVARGKELVRQLIATEGFVLVSGLTALHVKTNGKSTGLLVEAGRRKVERILKSRMAKKAAKNITKIPQNHYFDPIDVVGKVVS